MKPTNSKIPPCNPISSNCVIWQGPDIPCIDLCKGDTVSDVVHKLATELCNVLTQLDMSTIDLQCLGVPGCPPKDFQTFIQLLIDKICEQNNLTPSVATECPDCLVTVAPCFETLNSAGDVINQLQLVDYLKAIGYKVCTLVESINSLSSSVTGINNRVIGSTPTVTTTEIPNVTPQCVLPSVPTAITTVVTELEKQFCNLQSAIGTPTSIFAAMARECNGLGGLNRLSGSGTMSSITGWINTEVTLADNYNNLWLTICDMRAAIQYIKTNCCPSCCDDLQIDFTAIISGSTIKLFFNGTVPLGFTECSAGGTQFKIEDQSGNYVVVTVPVIALLNSPTGYSYNISATPLNPADNFTITAIFCIEPTDPTGSCSQCQTPLSYTIVNTANCPTLTFSSTFSSITYNFTHPGGAYTYIVELWNNTMTSVLASQTIPLPAAGPVSGTFSGLSVGTQYKIRVKVVIGLNTTTCGFFQTETLPDPCPAAESVTIEFNYVTT